MSLRKMFSNLFLFKIIYKALLVYLNISNQANLVKKCWQIYVNYFKKATKLIQIFIVNMNEDLELLRKQAA